MRDAHPYHMYEAVQSQPEAFAEVYHRVVRSSLSLGTGTRFRQVHLTGIGTSLHTCQIAELLWRNTVPTPVRSWNSFDFVNFGPTVNRDDLVIVVSHRGNKHYSARALEIARENDAATLIVTGAGSHCDPGCADVVVETVPQEQSSAHTVSHIGAVAALTALSRPLFGVDSLPDVGRLSQLLRHGLQTERQIEAWTKVDHSGIWLVGVGPSEVAARETALKIRETSYLRAEGIGLETLLHGPFQGADPREMFVLLVCDEVAVDRFQSLARMIECIGASFAVVTDNAGCWSLASEKLCVVPRAPYPFSALSCLTPLQLFSYHLALRQDANPDSFRLDDPRFASAFKHVAL